MSEEDKEELRSAMQQYERAKSDDEHRLEVERQEREAQLERERRKPKGIWKFVIIIAIVIIIGATLNAFLKNIFEIKVPILSDIFTFIEGIIVIGPIVSFIGEFIAMLLGLVIGAAILYGLFTAGPWGWIILVILLLFGGCGA